MGDCSSHPGYAAFLFTPSTGCGYISDIVRGINYVKNRRLSSDPSIRVINLSLGGGAYLCSCDDSDPDEAQAISQALTAGIITFAATGNEVACGGISAPACVSSAVRVAANYDAQYGFVDLGDCGDYAQPYWVVCFSNISEECNWLIAAPGYDISVGSFQHGDGTSQATAHCSGVAALMFDKSGPCGSLDAYTARNAIFIQHGQHP